MSRGPNLTGIVLAGGRSTRFGSDKASALFRGRPMLQVVVSALDDVCRDLVVVRAAGQQLPPFASALPVHVAEDEYEAEGPLAGMIAGLRHASDLAFVVSTDVPLLRPALVAGLAGSAPGHDIVLPHAGGFPQPLVAVYRAPSCLPVIHAAFERGVRKIVQAFEGLDVRRVPEDDLRAFDADLRSFRNANTPEALAELESLAAAEGPA